MTRKQTPGISQGHLQTILHNKHNCQEMVDITVYQQIVDITLYQHTIDITWYQQLVNLTSYQKPISLILGKVSYIQLNKQISVLITPFFLVHPGVLETVTFTIWHDQVSFTREFEGS